MNRKLIPLFVTLFGAGIILAIAGIWLIQNDFLAQATIVCLASAAFLWGSYFCLTQAQEAGDDDGE